MTSCTSIRSTWVDTRRRFVETVPHSSRRARSPPTAPQEYSLTSLSFRHRGKVGGDRPFTPQFDRSIEVPQPESSLRYVRQMATRGVTRARRDLTEEGLGDVPVEETRQLVHALLLVEGASIDHYRSGPGWMEYWATAPSLWTKRKTVIRICHSDITETSATEVNESMRACGAFDAIVIATTPQPSLPDLPDQVRVVSPGELVSRIVGSSLTIWDEGRPRLAVDRLELALRLTEQARTIDPVGIEWLPALALNEMPERIADLDATPQDLLERKAFRLLTASYRFGGVRYGEASRGQRLPDAVLTWPSGAPTAAMLDCKAASEGYRMTADHLLRFIQYWQALESDVRNGGHDLAYLIIVSSHFPGADDGRHPFHARAAEIREETGMKLAYVQASDLSWAAAQLELTDASLSARSDFDWDDLLQPGLVTSQHFSAQLQAIL